MLVNRQSLPIEQPRRAIPKCRARRAQSKDASDPVARFMRMPGEIIARFVSSRGGSPGFAGPASSRDSINSGVFDADTTMQGPATLWVADRRVGIEDDPARCNPRSG